jgi:two-component system response regulator GlrR
MSEHQSSLSATRVETTTPDRSKSERAGGAASSAVRATGRRRSDRIISASGPMQEVVDQASALARTNDMVLLTGPSGVGRKHVARAIHQWSARASGPLVELQVAGTSEPIQMRELFGDGTAANPGALAKADGGSLLIERADQLSPGAFTRLADSLRKDATATSQARVLATAIQAADGALEVLRGQFGGHRIQIPPLSSRVEDVLPLAAHFLAEFAADASLEIAGFSPEARRWLVEETWNGNVRELRERIRQSVRLSGNGTISAEALMLSSDGDEVPSFKDAKRAFETRYVEGLLRRCSGNISRAARMAKKDRKDFYDVIRRTGVDPSQFRG